MYRFLYFFVICAVFWGASSDVNNDCVPRKAANVKLQDLEGVWYVMMFVNESLLNEHRSCIKVTYNYNSENSTARVAESSIPYGSKNVIDEHVYVTMKDGVTDAIVTDNSTITTVHVTVTSIDKDAYMALTVCMKKNGNIVDDRLALYSRDRNMCRTRMKQVLKSMGVEGYYYYVRQKNCPN